ncbi:hypothetical protein B0H11DRAFT_1926093 [Mycena galericulata]|nr:hypothetical protein B0H11DRAFT_1926093 [Mycena galericulata]
MGARQRLFAATMRKLQHTFKTLETLHDVHGLFLLVGTRVHEDAEFAEFATTGVLDQLLPRLKLKPNELLGLAKVLAYNVKVSSLEATVADDDTAPSASAPPKASRPRKTKVIRKNMTHLTQEQKDELAKAAKVARAVEALRRVKNIRDDLSHISEADVNVDLWRDLPPRNGFAWKVVPQLLAQNNLRVVGFPHYVRPPPHFPGTKGIGGLHLKEMDALEDAIAAQEGSSVYGGLRIERYKYKRGGIVIFMHDYDNAPPPGDPTSAAVKNHWRTSGAAREFFVDGEGLVWSAPFDIDRDPKVTSSQRRRVWAHETKKGKVARGKGKAKEIGSDSDEDAGGDADEDETQTEKKAKPVRGNGKSKRIVSSDSDSDEDEEEYEDEEPTLPTPRVTRAMAAAQEGGGPAPKAVAKPATAKPAAPTKAAAPKAPLKPTLKAPNPSLAPTKKRVNFAPNDDDTSPRPAKRTKKLARGNADDDTPPPLANRKRRSPIIVPETEDEDDDDIPLGHRPKAQTRAKFDYVAAPPPPQFVQGSSKDTQGAQASAAATTKCRAQGQPPAPPSAPPPAPPPAPMSSAAPPLPDPAAALNAALSTLSPEALASVVDNLLKGMAPK